MDQDCVFTVSYSFGCYVRALGEGKNRGRIPCKVPPRRR